MSLNSNTTNKSYFNGLFSENPTLMDVTNVPQEIPSLNVMISRVSDRGHVGSCLRVSFIDEAFAPNGKCTEFTLYADVATFKSIEMVIQEQLGSIYIKDLVAALRNSSEDAKLLGATFRKSSSIWLSEDLAIGKATLNSAHVFAFSKLDQLPPLQKTPSLWTLRHVCQALSKGQFKNLTWDWRQTPRNLVWDDKLKVMRAIPERNLGGIDCPDSIKALLNSVCLVPNQWHTELRGNIVSLKHSHFSGFSFELAL